MQLANNIIARVILGMPVIIGGPALYQPASRPAFANPVLRGPHTKDGGTKAEGSSDQIGWYMVSTANMGILFGIYSRLP